MHKCTRSGLHLFQKVIFIFTHKDSVDNDQNYILNF